MPKPFPPAMFVFVAAVIAALPGWAAPLNADGGNAVRAAQAALTQAEIALKNARAEEKKASNAAAKTRARAAVVEAERRAAETAVAVARARNEPKPAATAARPVVSPEALIQARIDVEAAEREFARAVDARAAAERKAAEAIRALAHELARTAERKESALAADSDTARHQQLAEIEAMETRIKAGVHAATIPAAQAQARETEARARLETARRHEAEVRTAIESSLAAETR